MLFFGVFSSFIPYLAAALIYLLGVGIYTLNSRQKCDKEIICSEQLSIGKGSISFVDDLPDYFSRKISINQNNALSTSAIKDFELQPAGRTEIIKPPSAILSSLKPIYLSRPPPSVSPD